MGKKAVKPDSTLAAALQVLRRSRLRLGKVRGVVDAAEAGLDEADRLLKQHQAELAAARRPPGSLLAELEEKVKEDRSKN